MTEPQDARHLLDRADRAATAGDLMSANELLRDAARIQEEELGPHHPDLANTLTNLAIVAERTGSSSEAETLYRRAAAITAAALPSDHPMTVASRQNLEDFCREGALSVDAPAITAPTRDAEREISVFPSERAEPDQMLVRPDNTGINAFRPETTAPDRTPGQRSHLLQWVATAAIVLVAAVFLVLRPWGSSRDASSTAPPPEPAAAQPAEPVPPQIAEPPTRPAPIEPSAPPASAPRDDVPANKAPATGGIAVTTAQLCRTFSTSGSNWRCDPVGDTAAPGPMVFYTRVRSPRDTTVVHRWYRGDTLRQSVTLTIQANAREGYRTYTRLTVNEGNWRLELRSADGSLLHEQRFAVH